MPLVLGFNPDATNNPKSIVLVGNSSSRAHIDRTGDLASAMKFLDPVEALVWIENLDGRLTDKMRAPDMPRLELYADHDLSIGPMGWVELEPIAERKTDRTWLVTAHYHPLPAAAQAVDAA